VTPDSVIDIGQQAMEVTALLAAVVLLPALVIGLLVAMFQAATQINEMTLSFIPKLMVVALVLMLAGPWMLRVLMNFSQSLIGSVPELIG
jgi:flagellar biosynthetic protein FliQ